MRVIREGHKYELDQFEKENPSVNRTIQFIEKVKRSESPVMSSEDSDPNELITINNGTTNEEVLKMLINRMYYLQGKFPCRENSIVITKLEESLMWLDKRTEDRKSRGVEGKHIK